MNIEIYTGTGCGYCTRAKALLNSSGMEFTEINAREVRDELLQRLEATGKEFKMTIPQIFIDDEYVGGHDDLVVWLKKHKVDEAE